MFNRGTEVLPYLANAKLGSVRSGDRFIVADLFTKQAYGKLKTASDSTAMKRGYWRVTHAEGGNTLLHKSTPVYIERT
jgi:hypothetical protein